MIKLEKLAEPEVLQENGACWTQEYLAAIENGNITSTVRYRYRHAQIKQTIKDETSEKCAYCESKVTHTYPGDVEHINPCAHFPEQIYVWANLTLACGECNRRKGDYHSANEPLINPYVDDPEAHLFAAGTLVFGKPGDGLGLLAQLKLELNRAALIERRLERIKALNSLADCYASQPDGETKTLLENELRKEMADDVEYALASRAFLKAACNIEVSN